jgi:hypothetical protein
MKGECTTWNMSNGGMLASDGQGNSLLQNKLLNLNSGDGASVFFPLFNLEGLVLIVRSTSLLVQNDRAI